METRYSYGGDEFIFVELDISMSLEVNFRILALTQEIERQKIPGVTDVCPANASYLVRFLPEEIRPQKLIECLRDIEKKAAEIRSIKSRYVDIPVLYDDPWTKECAKQFGDRHQDPSVSNLEYLMRINGFKSREDFIAAYSSAPWWISMIGFAPGTAWGFQMVPRERAIQAPKYVRPRTDTPERAVSHGGVFLAIYPVRGPGGYQLMGMTPVPMYDPTRTLIDLQERFILAEAGDRWRMRSVEMDEFQSIRTAVEAGVYRYRIVKQEFVPAKYFRDPERYLAKLQAEAERC